MSEYWKSTPKYWCKHCKTYVRDTKLEKQNHDATPKHQGNIKRFLRDLHRGNERDEREKQRAKDEVARLNGVPSAPAGPSATGSADLPRRRAVPPAASPNLRQVTPAERKQQLAQLAELGVAVPEDYRREVAMAGDWQTLSERAIYDEFKEEEAEEDGKSSGLNVGIRKRKLEGQDEDEEDAGAPVARRVWGSTTRTYPGRDDLGEDLDALLGTTTMIRRGREIESNVKAEGNTTTITQTPPTIKAESTKGESVSCRDTPTIKKEESLTGPVISLPSADDDATVKDEDEAAPGAGPIFKKRKPKSIRQK